MELKEQITLSIIVPCYNVAQYLKDSLSALVAQFSDWTHAEVILINDGSTDETLQILEEVVSIYPHIFKLINKENGGVSSARNAGIALASGKWIAFFDPDDELVPNGYESILFHASRTEADVISFGCQVIRNRNDRFTTTAKKSTSALLYTIDEFANTFKLGSSVVFAYKKEILNLHALVFPDLSAIEDAVFNFMYFRHVAMVARINEIIYLYHVNDGSATTSKNPIQVRRNVKDVWKGIRIIQENATSIPNDNLSKHFLQNCRFYFFSTCARITNTNLKIPYIQELTASAKTIGFSIPRPNNIKEFVYLLLFYFPTIWGGVSRIKALLKR